MNCWDCANYITASQQQSNPQIPVPEPWKRFCVCGICVFPREETHHSLPSLGDSRRNLSLWVEPRSSYLETTLFSALNPVNFVLLNFSICGAGANAGPHALLPSDLPLSCASFCDVTGSCTHSTKLPAIMLLVLKEYYSTGSELKGNLDLLHWT